MTVNSVKPVWVHWLKGCTIIFILTFLDQGSKYFVLTRLKNTPDIILIPGVLQLHYLENRGMAFGLFEGKIPVFVILCFLFFFFLPLSFLIGFSVFGGLLTCGRSSKVKINQKRLFLFFLILFHYQRLTENPSAPDASLEAP